MSVCEDFVSPTPWLMHNQLAQHGAGWPSPKAVTRSNSSIRQASARQQLAQRIVEEPGVFRILRRIAGAVAPDRRDRTQLGVRHLGDLAPIVLDAGIRRRVFDVES